MASKLDAGRQKVPYPPIWYHWNESKAAMSDSGISVLHLSHRDEEALLDTRKQIAGELESGRDVVLVIDEPVHDRADRMTVASLFLKNCRGRFAVVSEQDQLFTQLPQVMRERLQVFTSTEAAMQWLKPCDFDAKQTMLYMSLN